MGFIIKLKSNVYGIALKVILGLLPKMKNVKNTLNKYEIGLRLHQILHKIFSLMRAKKFPTNLKRPIRFAYAMNY